MILLSACAGQRASRLINFVGAANRLRPKLNGRFRKQQSNMTVSNQPLAVDPCAMLKVSSWPKPAFLQTKKQNRRCCFHSPVDFILIAASASTASAGSRFDLVFTQPARWCGSSDQVVKGAQCGLGLSPAAITVCLYGTVVQSPAANTPACRFRHGCLPPLSKALQLHPALGLTGYWSAMPSSAFCCTALPAPSTRQSL